MSLAGFNKNITRSGDGEQINYVYNITLEGHLLPFKGSPDSTGAFWTGPGYPSDETPTTDKELRNILAKQIAIGDLAAIDGALWEIQPWDGGPNVKFNPRTVNIEWPQDLLITDSVYRINLEAPHIFYEGNLGSGYLDIPTIANYNVSEIGESWNVELNEEEEFWTIRRDLSAKGDRVFNENGTLRDEPWHEARRWCQAQASSGLLPDFARFTSPSTSGLAGFVGYNYARAEIADKKGGTYSLSETWVATSGNRPYIESYEVMVSRNNEDGLDTVSINGEIRGLDYTTSIPYAASGKLQMANTAFSGIWNAQSFSDITYARAKKHSEVFDLNIIPKAHTIGKREKQGIITYSREYDNRPLNMISGSLIERFTINDDFPTPIRPAITVPGRPAILFQDIGANTEAKRTVQITIVMDRKKEPYASIFAGINAGGSGYNTLPRPNVSGIANLFQPIGVEIYNWNLQQNSENWSPQSLKLEKTVSWISNAL